MHETPEDLAALQKLLDDSYARAGEHLKTITTPERRIAAEPLCKLLTGVRILNLATVTAAGEPRVAPVDGLFYRGHWYFGSAHNSVRFRHIRARPQVSAAHTVGEELAVTVHGIATELNLSIDENLGFRKHLAKVYPGWESWAAGNPYARIEAEAMFTFGMTAG
jgi:uncharacterized pyridoxamine 5'-phosphate oxidase family protein